MESKCWIQNIVIRVHGGDGIKDKIVGRAKEKLLLKARIVDGLSTCVV